MVSYIAYWGTPSSIELLKTLSLYLANVFISKKFPVTIFAPFLVLIILYSEPSLAFLKGVVQADNTITQMNAALKICFFVYNYYGFKIDNYLIDLYFLQGPV